MCTQKLRVCFKCLESNNKDIKLLESVQGKVTEMLKGVGRMKMVKG